MANEPTHGINSENADSEIEARRTALKKMGMFAAYTTPVVLGVLTPRKTMAASGAVSPPPIINIE